MVRYHIVLQPNRHFHCHLAKIVHMLFIVGSHRGSHVKSGSAWCPCGIIGHFPKPKMATENAEISQINSFGANLYCNTSFYI